MPWEVKQDGDRYCVHKKGESSPIKGGCHSSREDAVKHLRALYANEPDAMKYSLIVFNEDTLIDTEDPNVKWIQAWRYGSWNHPRYGKIEITPEKALQFKQHFDTGTIKREHLINYDHGVDPAKGGKAAGQILAIDPRVDSIYYKVRFNDIALKEIQAGEWRYISPEFKDVYTDPETEDIYENVPFDLALTNVPFFRGMEPLNFSEVASESDKLIQEQMYQSELPDDAFLFIDGGKRHLPVKDKDGKIDLTKLEEAITILSDRSEEEWLTDSVRRRLLAKARKLKGTNKPKGGSLVDDLLKKFADKLGLEIPEDADEDQVLKLAEKLNETIEPLRRTKEDGERNRTFREAFPDQWEKIQKLEAQAIESDAMKFADSYSRFTLRDGENEWKSHLGFSERVKEKIAEVHKKFSHREATHADLKALLDVIGDKGIVDYAETGSSRTGEAPMEFSEDPKLAFSQAVKRVMDEDSLEYEGAIRVAATKFPALYDAYLNAVPHAK